MEVLFWSLLPGCLIGGFLFFCHRRVTRAGARRLFEDAETIPCRPVGLVLGTSPLLASGRPNRFFTHRVEAAAALYHARKVERLLLSGHHDGDYNEPARFRESLLALGVPEAALLLDGGGHRTLESVLRAKTLYGITHCTVISQRFHVERALLLADHCGVSALGYCAHDVTWRGSWRTRLRELFARARAVFDCSRLRR
ncbi:MAG TPA: ElyC/SanA/YdcF family protein [Chthoniobacteraceae bacterium]|nr:ElyC/SanA/YdcF family protein [Chthoniobacteraceae bacterium]